MNISTTAALWINANPSFKHFDGRIIRYISNKVPIAYWEYHQELDEASSLDIALILLHDYLKYKSEPIDIIGHGTGGLLALLYARKYPHRVKSLTLLGVGSAPSIDWQAHYYQMRKLLPCSQDVVLDRLVKMMFGHQSRRNVANLIDILQRDLVTAPTAHSIYQIDRTESGGVSMPMMVCGSQQDGIVDPSNFQGWTEYLKNDDILWTIPQGHHFFHYFFPEYTGRKIIKFWQNINQQTRISSKSSSEEICCRYF